MCDVDEMCAVLGSYTVYSDNSLPMFWDRLVVLKSQQGITAICCIMTQKSANSKCLKFGGGGRGSSLKNKNINCMQYTTCKSLALHHIAHHYGVINRLFFSKKKKL